ncbi:MAG: STAS domain-containing protein [Pseudomonadota bacterium]
MELTLNGDGPVDIVTVHAERIDAVGAVAFKDAFRAKAQGRNGTVVLDLHQVTFLDSSGLGAVVAAQKILGNERKLELACLQDAVAKVMSLTRMDTVFRIHTNIAAAEASHSSSAA